MIVHCPQQRVRSVEIAEEFRPCCEAPVNQQDLFAWAPVVKPVFQPGVVDPFESYYEASRKRRPGPHHRFAGITDAVSMSSFFEEFGFPAFGGYSHPLLLGQVLAEAKRIRLLMEAWDASGDRVKSRAREILGELTFALGDDAHWWYWPPLFNVAGTAASRFSPLSEDVNRGFRALEERRRDLERRRGYDRNRAIRSREPLSLQLNAMTAAVCAEPLKTSEHHPDWSAQALRLILKPVRLLGRTPEGDRLEMPHLRAPYGLMFLMDLSEGRESRACADNACRSMFIASRPDRKFCTSGCAHRSVVRNARRRVRAAKNQRARAT
jgi:hypothetical protein